MMKGKFDYGEGRHVMRSELDDGKKHFLMRKM